MMIVNVMAMMIVNQFDGYDNGIIIMLVMATMIKVILEVKIIMIMLILI